MLSREAKCPECGFPLSVSVERVRGEIVIILWCEGDGEDVFSYEIFTDLKDFKDLKPTNRKVEKIMKIRVIRKSDDSI